MKGHQQKVDSILIGRLQPGDFIEFRTANSVYRFWIEFPERAIGVAEGGHMRGPSRVLLAAESAGQTEVASRPIRVGDRLFIILLGPEGEPVRHFVTSPVASVSVIVQPTRHVAA